ncbi:hypothetical protein SASPL_143451 [Salvia splendens]|uniref:Rhamnogalacturonase A/B/Epimerase-like pectate lyase domain-containing protein n=1 Tax=Salvia splendens TaxID=180675 RepID=A0A8X8WM33_SALSN|nr:hypothetical protein SASPL_143451 [Salvia splendens]
MYKVGYALGGYPLDISHAELTIQIQPWNSDSRRVSKTANVVDFGAKGDGKSDDTKAFQSAWKSACSSKEDVTFVIGGTIVASDNHRADYSKDRRHWLIFQGVDNLVVIKEGSSHIFTCGPGHGISIGSLGAGNSEAHVSDVVVNRVNFSGTTNGVRIKTWQKSAVKISNILYQNIKGTSATEGAVDFECSKSHPCQEIGVDNVRLGGTNGGKSKAVCKNIHLKSIGTVSPHCP